MIIYKCVTNLSEAEGLVLICVFKVITIACEGEKNYKAIHFSCHDENVLLQTSWGFIKAGITWYHHGKYAAQKN